MNQTISDPAQVFALLEARINDRKARLAQLARESATQLGIAPPQGQMVSGHYVAPSVFQNLNQQVVDPLVRRQEEQSLRQQLEQDLAQYQAMDAQERAKFFATKPTGAEQPGPVREGETLPNLPPTQQQRLQWLNQGSSAPSLRGTIEKAIEDDLIKAPERDEQREWKSKEYELLRESRREQLAAQLQARLAELQLRLEDRGLDRASREQLARESNDLKRYLGELMADVRRDVAQARIDAVNNKPPRPLPAAQSKAWTENSVGLQKVDEALAALKKNPDAVGLKSIIPDIALQRLDPDGVATRAKITDIGSMKIHDRSGAAVSAREFPRLIPFIPNNTDTAASAKTKLENFKREYELIQKEILEYAEGQGYRLPSSSGGATGSWGVPVGTVDSGYRYKGGDPSQPSSWERVK